MKVAQPGARSLRWRSPAEDSADEPGQEGTIRGVAEGEPECGETALKMHEGSCMDRITDVRRIIEIPGICPFPFGPKERSFRLFSTTRLHIPANCGLVAPQSSLRRGIDAAYPHYCHVAFLHHHWAGSRLRRAVPRSPRRRPDRLAARTGRSKPGVAARAEARSRPPIGAALGGPQESGSRSKARAPQRSVRLTTVTVPR